MTDLARATAGLGGGVTPPRLRRLAPVAPAASLAAGLAEIGDVADLVEPVLPSLVESITEGVQRRVDAYAGSDGGRRQRLIRLAVGSAVRLYVRRVSEGDVHGDGVDDLFRRMGHGEAVSGNDLHPMRDALSVATQDAWRTLHALASAHGIGSDLLGPLGDSLLEFIEHLREQVDRGHRAGLQSLTESAGRRRAVLVDSLLSGRPDVLRALRLDVLGPLAGLGPRTRDALHETLIAWLPTRPTADDLAEVLGVHPQTVRRRLRRLRSMWGDDLEDPDYTVALLLALRSPDAPA